MSNDAFGNGSATSVDRTTMSEDVSTETKRWLLPSGIELDR